MSRDFPDWINPWTAAQGRRQFAGTMPIKRMQRLVPLLEHDGGEVAFTARFGLNEDRRPVIDLTVDARLPLMCQASLEPYEQPVARSTSLAVVESEGEFALLAADLDPVQADNGRIALASLVEDELLLGLPQVPRNPETVAVRYSTGEDEAEGAGDTAASPGGERKPNPFAVLKGKVGQGPGGGEA